MDAIWAFVRNVTAGVIGFVTDSRTIAVAFIIALLLVLIGLITVISKWRLYSKAGLPGWAPLVPFYGDYALVRLAGFSGWYFPITLIPIPSLDTYTFAILQILVARAFGKGIIFGLGLYALPWIFYPMLWMSGAEYRWPKYSLPDAIRKIKTRKGKVPELPEGRTPQ